MIGKKHSFDLEVRFCDLDSLAHVNNAVYLSYLELSRIRWLTANKINSTVNGESRVPLILARTELDFRIPIFWGDKISCDIWLESVGNKSFTLSYEIQKNSEKDLCTQAKSIQVWFDYKTQTSRPLPEHIRQRLLE